MGFFKNFVKALSDPVNVAAAVVATAVLGPVGGATFLQSVAIRAATTAALSSAAQSLSPKPKLPEFASFTADATGRTQMVKQPITARRAVYGQTRVSGPLALIESTDDDKYLHLVVLLAAHECQEITTVYLNDEALTLDGNGNVTAPSRYANLVRVNKHLGGTNQAADADLVSEVSAWTDQHRLRGIAYVYLRLESDPDAFPNGIPNVSALVKGKKLYDPRDGTTAYGTNPALVIRDYLTNASYGFSASATEIDDTAFTTAANICDETVTLAAGGTEKRYECHGTIDSANAPRQTLEALLTSCGGILTFTNGVFGVKAAKYVSPALTLVNDDLRGPIGVQTKRSRRDNFNAVKGIFAPPSTNYVPTDYPALISSTFQTEDGGVQQFLDYDLPYTQSSPMAQRLSKIALYRNRQQVTMDFPANLKAFQLAVGDTVQVTNDRFGFSSKVFEVAEWALVFEGSDNGTTMGVDLMLRELASSVYDWNAEEADFLQDNSTLPNPFELTAPSVVTADVLRAFNETAISVLQVTVTSASIYAKQFEVQAKKSDETEFTSLGIGSGNVFELLDVEDSATYNVRARIINGLGVRSPFTTADHQVVGKTAPPEDVTNFSVNIIGTEAHLSWTPVGDLDLSHYHVRHARETTGATYQNAIDLAPKVSRPANTVIVPAMTGTYFIKAVDKLGNASINPTSKVAIIEEIKGLNVVATSTQHPAFSGTKTGVIVDGTTLKLKSGINFDDLTGNFDDAPGQFDGAGGNTGTSGTYDFANYVDLGAIYTSRVTATLNVTRIDYGIQFDSREGLFDAATGNFDGDAQAEDDTNVELLVSVTDDDPSGSPTWSDYSQFFVGDYKARALRFRAKLTSIDGQATPGVTALSVTVDMPDRVISETDQRSFVNLIDQEEAFDNWFAGSGVIVTADQIANPVNGQVTADLVAKPATAFKYIERDVTDAVETGTYTYSVYAKAGTNTDVSMLVGPYSTQWARAVFDLSAGTAGTPSSVSATNVSAAIESLADGWFRCSITATFSVTSPDHQFYIYPGVYNAAVAGNVYLWGAQVERASSASTFESHTNGSKVVTYIPAFKAVQGIGISASNLNSGDYYVITSKSATGFTIAFYNSSDEAVDRTFDFVAKGYGEVAA